MLEIGDGSWALFAKSVLDRTRLALASKGEFYHQLLQPSAEYLGARLNLDQWAVCDTIFFLLLNLVSCYIALIRIHDVTSLFTCVTQAA